MKMENKSIYVVTQGDYEEKENVLVTTNLDKAIKKYLEDKSSEIEIWISGNLIHEYGVFKFEGHKYYDDIYFDIKFIEQNGHDKYMYKRTGY